MRRFALFSLLILFTAAAWIAVRPHSSYATQDREQAASPASIAHPAGTDTLGRDRLTRVAVATLLGLAGAASAAALATVIAAAVGMLAAFGPALLAAPLLLVCDAFLALPWLFLLMMVRSGMPLKTAPLVSAAATFLILALLGWPACARAVYAGSVGIRSADWMIQARACGLRTPQLMRRHVLPQIAPLLLPQFLISVPAFVIAEANLGTLGLGVSEPLPSWGSMLLELDNSAMLGGSGWIYLPIVVLVLTLVLLELLLVEA
jgi:ABC-type dipeptide/oligopeptide/nickel transport system permease subunit